MFSGREHYSALWLQIDRLGTPFVALGERSVAKEAEELAVYQGRLAMAHPPGHQDDRSTVAEKLELVWMALAERPPLIQIQLRDLIGVA